MALKKNWRSREQREAVDSVEPSTDYRSMSAFVGLSALEMAD